MEPHIGLTVGLILLVCVTWMTGYIWRDANVVTRLSSVASCFFSLVTIISSAAGLVASSH